jgi:Icc protein
VLALPGNHDDPALLAASLPGSPVGAPRVHPCGDWAIALLDSQQPGECGGRLGPERLALLAERLAASTARHWLLAVHHPPMTIGSPWMDAMGLADGPALLKLLARDGRVRAVVCGHVHQRFEARYQGIQLLSCPATRVQFAPRTSACRVEDGRPAFRWLELAPDGRVGTGVVRLPEPI